jgi:ERCC4-type nuclease
MEKTRATLPALKNLGDLSNHRPVIVIDNREHAPLVFTNLQTIRGTLRSGDYSISGLTEQFAVERKTIADLVACCMGENRERFERELHRLRGYRFARLLIVGTKDEVRQSRYISNIQPKSVFATIGAFEARYVPVVFGGTPELSAKLIEVWAWWFAREVVEDCNSLWRGVVAGKEETA